MSGEDWSAVDAFARTTGRLEAVGVAMCGEEWRKFFRADRDGAIRALIVRIEGERRMCAAFARMTNGGVA
jgi:hypothetical protein